MQNLILPFNDCTVTAGFLNKKYKQKFGWTHYGVDLIDRSTRAIWGSGTGVVVDCGNDRILGNVVVVKYDKAHIHHGKYKGVRDIIIRYAHLDTLNVRKGQKVTTNTRLGNFGGSGFGLRNKWAPHLHLEMDVDTQYPTYTPTISAHSNIMKAGTASTVIEPFDVFKIDSGGQFGGKQVLKYQSYGYVDQGSRETLTLKHKLHRGIPVK